MPSSGFGRLRRELAKAGRPLECASDGRFDRDAGRELTAKPRWKRYPSTTTRSTTTISMTSGERDLRPGARNDAQLDCRWEAPHRQGMRFHVIRPHAQGGIGKVSVAFDAELQREVALKQIKPERADDADSRARFLLEAEVTGRLEHPGIVPVYGLGVDDSGRPFYAMRFVRGSSFEEAIKRFHRDDADPARDPQARSFEFRQLLDRFVAVCQTIAYAHSRGVLHRDLKPANVLLGPFKESLVVDWGLAKVITRQPETGRIAAAG